MPTDALALALLLLAAVLALSAVGKLREPEASAAAFGAMRVPAPLARPWMVRALPWLELVLAVGLVILGGAAGVAVASAALALCVAYLALVVRARGFAEDVDCACFGSLGSGRVTTRTVLRNGWLVLLAGVGALALGTTRGGRSVLGRLVDGALPWWWLAAAAAAAATVVLVLGEPAGDAHATQETPVELAGPDGDYLRSRTPAVPVTLADGTTTHLRALSEQRAQLLVYVSDWCTSCHDVVEAVPRWRETLAPLDVRLVLRDAPSETTLTHADEPQSVHDTEALLNLSFGMRATPSAILLGADGLLAGGPVVGRDEVLEFVEDIAVELGGTA